MLIQNYVHATALDCATELDRTSKWSATRDPISPLTQYLNHIRKYQRLSQEEINENIRKYKSTGYHHYLDAVINANLRLVAGHVLKYHGIKDTHLQMDLIQAGNIGLIEGIKKFDPKREKLLSTYVMFFIKAEIYKYIFSTQSPLTISQNPETKKIVSSFLKLKDQHISFEALIKAVMEETQLSNSLVRDTVYALNITLSELSDAEFDSEATSPVHIGLDWDSWRSMPVNFDLNNLKYHDDLSAIQIRILIEQYRSRLNPYKKTILDGRVLSKSDSIPFKEIAEEYGITQQAVGLMEKAIFNELVQFLRRKLSIGRNTEPLTFHEFHEHDPEKPKRDQSKPK